MYSYRVIGYEEREGPPLNGVSPSISPTLMPDAATDPFTVEVPPQPSDSGLEIVRQGLVFDLGNGNYTALICPVIAGIHEIHVLYNGGGISNQPFRVLNKYGSYDEIFAEGSHLGQYVAASPYELVVSHTVASPITSTASGDGLTGGITGFLSSFMVTVRDPFDNILRSPPPSAVVTARLDLSPGVTFSVWDYHNGSFLLQYTPIAAANNILSVFINGHHILASPFYPQVESGTVSASTSYAIGSGLTSGVTGEISYFQIYSFDGNGNRESVNNNNFTFIITGTNNITGDCEPCPLPPTGSHPICDPLDSKAGHYFCQYMPRYSGEIKISVYLKAGDPPQLQQLSGSPFFASITSSGPSSAYTDISGMYIRTILALPYIYSSNTHFFYHLHFPSFLNGK